MKYYLIIILIVPGLFLLFMTGCNKDDSEVQEKGDYTPYAYASAGIMTEALDSIYDILKLGEKVERVEFYGTIASGDAMAGGSPGGNDAGLPDRFMRLIVTADHPYIRNYWYQMFRGIMLTNRLILNATESLEQAEIEESIIYRSMGEAWFLKGLFYYKLSIMFCGFPQMQPDYNHTLLGLPLLDNVFDPDSLSDERSPLRETWEAIAGYFSHAAELLPERSAYGPNDIGRASRGAALSMLAKVYVFTENWSDGFNNARTVIESGEYGLPGSNEFPGPFTVTRLTKEGETQVDMPGYKWIWQAEANNCVENIFDVGHYADHSTRYPEGQEGNLIPQYYGVRGVWIYNESGELINRDYFWGFILPTSYFVETAYRDIGGENEEGEILDPRYKLSVIAPGDSVPYYYEDDELRAVWPDSVLFNAWYNWICTGFATWKYFTDPYFLQQRSTLGDNPQNTKFYRYADLLLLGAEAALHTGNTNYALEWVNQVRERARNSGNTGYPAALNEVTLEDIWAERRVELAFEGHQLFDLIRTRRTEQVLTQDAMGYATVTHPETNYTAPQQFGDNFIPGKSEILPIPEVAITNSGGLLKQNPGY